MQESDFETLLDRYGTDLSRWRDASQRTAAAALLASSSEARALLARTVRLADLINAATTPPPPALDILVERATAYPQMAPPRPERPVPDKGWLGLGRWHAVAFASCLVLGIVLGVGSAAHPDPLSAVYDMVDGSHVGDLHE